jgi:phospholipid/cholesterol/gamma-HCH transport system permease protein
MDATTPETHPHGTLNVTRPTADTLCVQLSGQWTIYAALPSTAEVQAQCEALPRVRRLSFAASDLADWDSALLTFLLKLKELCDQRQIEFDRAGLPHGVQRLLALATAVPEHHEARREATRASLLVRLGQSLLDMAEATRTLLTFLGQVALAFVQFIRGRARLRAVDLWLIMQASGAQALPIVSLISFLVGLILAFMGANQLRQFGAQIYVANLVGLSMAREMGAMMTGIIMAGRTGAAFAAQLGTMVVNQEIDALITLGLKPVEFLVVPRMLALMLMVPLLCIYADLVGILGGAVVGVGMLHLGAAQYYQQTLSALHLLDFVVGLIKGTVFGILIALAGCLRGMQCGRSASAVGAAATSAVVTGIVWIIVSDAVLTVMYDILGI